MSGWRYWRFCGLIDDRAIENPIIKNRSFLRFFLFKSQRNALTKVNPCQSWLDAESSEERNVFVISAFIIVVLIWSTTPLAIHWSAGADTGFMLAVTLRMFIALVLALLINAVLRRPLFSSVKSCAVYFVASIGIFPAMPLVYWSAQFIPTGLIAVMFAFSPFITGIFSWAILGENPFSRRNIVALCMALTGLVIIFSDQLSLGGHALLGVLGVLLSSGIFSFSSVLLKKINAGVGAFEQTTGALLFAVPSLCVLWWLTDGRWPTVLDNKSFGAIVYLALMGSLLGFTLFFYVLNNLRPVTVSLITLITPVLALIAGTIFEREMLTGSTLIGVMVIMSSLGLYLGVFSLRKVHFG